MDSFRRHRVVTRLQSRLAEYTCVVGHMRLRNTPGCLRDECRAPTFASGRPRIETALPRNAAGEAVAPVSRVRTARAGRKTNSLEPADGVVHGGMIVYAIPYGQNIHAARL
jgi:hypothetical protein